MCKELPNNGGDWATKRVPTSGVGNDVPFSSILSCSESELYGGRSVNFHVGCIGCTEASGAYYEEGDVIK